MSNRLEQLFSAEGQSPWLDNLQRSYLTSGKLAGLVSAGVRGLTTNPAIFQKALQGSADYDSQFVSLMSAGASIEDAYWTMVLQDIDGALDVFAPLYNSSHGGDGFVSVEVDPRLAHDSFGTIEAARTIHQRVARPNVMIKIPATTEGVPAIRTMIREGRNVNVTLIFSLQRYQEVLEAYVAGLEDRAADGNSVAGVASVASFFVSRVDSEVDNQLGEMGSTVARELRGTAAINQARLAYEHFLSVTSSQRWKALSQSGASVQRLLWASTSTKNPIYPDTMYVDQLIGPDTVNTLPDATLDAFADHGVVSRTVDKDMDQVHTQWSALSSLGIDMEKVSLQLETDAVAGFVKSFDDLLGTLKDKAATL